MHCGPGYHLGHLPRSGLEPWLHFADIHFGENPMHGSGDARKRGGTGSCKNVPKGCLAVYVGRGEQLQRVIIPVAYINHPLFEKLLKEAEEEYGFEYEKGTVTIPCHVAHFQRVQELIDEELHSTHGVGCFRSGT